MNKPFSEMVKDGRYDTEWTLKTLDKIANEVNSLLNENARLMVENKELKRQIKMYQDSINEGIKESRANMTMALKPV